MAYRCCLDRAVRGLLSRHGSTFDSRSRRDPVTGGAASLAGEWHGLAFAGYGCWLPIPSPVFGNSQWAFDMIESASSGSDLNKGPVTTSRLFQERAGHFQPELPGWRGLRRCLGSGLGMGGCLVGFWVSVEVPELLQGRNR